MSSVFWGMGNSRDTLPALLDRLERANLGCDFALIDGDHSELGVSRDARCFLRRPLRDCYVLMHDSFNPECRHGIESVGFQASAYCHYFDVQFLPGHLGSKPPWVRQMWGGFALAVLKPTERPDPLRWQGGRVGVFELVLPFSVHGPARRRLRALTVLRRYLPAWPVRQ